ncbi:hypothetical protein [Streptomyces sp. NPDC048142]|uniref:hypothetical protein n=1 Tax=Streptomyces sp. NPDC048142 TaxID=3365501 RepID=UPI0037169E13
MENVTGSWVVLGYGRPADDYYEGPAPYSAMSETVLRWNDHQTAREQRGEAIRGTLQRWFIKRIAD